MIFVTITKEEKEYLKIVHTIHEKHHIQTRLFTMIPLAVGFELFKGHCEMCEQKLRSRPMYLVKFPNLEKYQVRFWCNYCASLHSKYIISLIITKN